jgi:hypothetical protein
MYTREMFQNQLEELVDDFLVFQNETSIENLSRVMLVKVNYTYMMWMGAGWKDSLAKLLPENTVVGPAIPSHCEACLYLKIYNTSFPVLDGACLIPEFKIEWNEV